MPPICPPSKIELKVRCPTTRLEDFWRITTLELEVRELQSRLERLEQDVKPASPLSPPPLHANTPSVTVETPHSHSSPSPSTPSIHCASDAGTLQARLAERVQDTMPNTPPSPITLPANTPPVMDIAPQCLTSPSTPVPSITVASDTVTSAFARTFTSALARMTPSRICHFSPSQICCVILTCIALVGWWKVLFEHWEDAPTVLRVDQDTKETMTVDELSRFVLSLGFDPSPVYLPLVRDEYLVDAAALSRDL